MFHVTISMFYIIILSFIPWHFKIHFHNFSFNHMWTPISPHVFYLLLHQQSLPPPFTTNWPTYPNTTWPYHHLRTVDPATSANNKSFSFSLDLVKAEKIELVEKRKEKLKKQLNFEWKVKMELTKKREKKTTSLFYRFKFPFTIHHTIFFFAYTFEKKNKRYKKFKE